jgi:hypothetical protein
VLLSTPLHASSNFTVFVQLANKRGFTKKKKNLYSELERVYPALNVIIVSKLGTPSDEAPKLK